jgi:hypothetical protein
VYDEDGQVGVYADCPVRVVVGVWSLGARGV